MGVSNLKRNWPIVFKFMLLLVSILLLQSMANWLFVWEETNYLAQPYDFRGLVKAGIYKIGYLLCVIAIILAVFTKHKLVRLVLLLWIFLSYSIDLFVQYMGSPRGISVEELSIAVSQVHLITNMRSYLVEIIVSFAIIGVLFYSFYFLFRKLSWMCHWIWTALIWLTACVFTYQASSKIYSVLPNSFPAPTKALNIIYQFIKEKNEPVFRLLNKNVTPAGLPQSKNIIWMIDESATASYMDINGYDVATTPSIDSVLLANSNCINLGITNSISNCSHYSNLFLRLGMTPEMSYDTLSQLPSIISYAKQAGYKVQMYDAQITKGEMTNFLTPEEMSLIDELYTLDRSVLPHLRDAQLTSQMLKRIGSQSKSEKAFIIFIKFGCHWPYLLNFDNSKTKFSPIQPSTYTRMVPENKTLIVNTYLNSIYQNVDQHLTKLITDLDPNHNFLFYTSDHGQSIIENGSPRTHCTNQGDTIPNNEFSVPLILYSAGLDTIKWSKDNYSQIQIFPSTLAMMGYDSSVVNTYGRQLWKGPIVGKRRSFITGTGRIQEFR